MEKIQKTYFQSSWCEVAIGVNMRFQKYLQEEFVGSRPLFSYSAAMEANVEFFLNPTAKEMKIAYDSSGKGKVIRFFIDFDKKEVIIWDGSVLHTHAIKAIAPKKKESKLFLGAAEFTSGKMRIELTDIINTKLSHSGVVDVISQMKKHQKWLSKYFTNIKAVLLALNLNV